MPSSSAMFVMVWICVLFRSALSYYQEGATENEGDFDELKNGVIGGEWKSGSNEDAGTYSSYPADSIKRILLKNDPQLFFLTSMQRGVDDMTRLHSSTHKRSMKKKKKKKNNIKDDTQKAPGKSTLSIISPLQALQRKVAVVYNTRQRERNRGLLDNWGRKRSVPSSRSYLDSSLSSSASSSSSFSDQNEQSQALQSDQEKLMACCSPFERRLYGLYRVP